MGSAFIKWLPGTKTFVGTDSTNHSVVLSTAAEGTGIKPSDLLLIALGACTAVDVVGILEKKRTPLHSLEIEVNGVQDVDPPWTFRKVHIHYKINGEGITESGANQAIHLAEDKYCSVSSTIRDTAEVTTSFELL